MTNQVPKLESLALVVLRQVFVEPVLESFHKRLNYTKYNSSQSIIYFILLHK